MRRSTAAKLSCRAEPLNSSVPMFRLPPSNSSQVRTAKPVDDRPCQVLPCQHNQFQIFGRCVPCLKYSSMSPAPPASKVGLVVERALPAPSPHSAPHGKSSFASNDNSPASPEPITTRHRPPSAVSPEIVRSALGCGASAGMQEPSSRAHPSWICALERQEPRSR